MDKLGIIKIQKFSNSKDTMKNMKLQATPWKEVLANHLFIKILISRICKNLLQTT